MLNTDLWHRYRICRALARVSGAVHRAICGAMSSIPLTVEFRSAVALTNDVAPARYARLLERILNSLPTKAKIFTEAEEERLSELLKLSAAQLDTLVAASCYIFESAAYQMVRRLP
eukprot:scaffold1254_cov251-Pinguiococcus_pyrenoidosus.AAC.9